jgi:cytochrome c peroxidase
MNKIPNILFALGVVTVILLGCQRNTGEGPYTLDAVKRVFGTSLPTEPPLEYNTFIPSYIGKDKLSGDTISNREATLGRALFYDKNLSDNGTIACASCHIQSFAFGDTAQRSLGLNGGLTGRHSMRLINVRYESESSMFWDERALSLEDQVLKPIQDHVEMGFSGTEGQPNLNDLVERLNDFDYYQELFDWTYGTKEVTAQGIESALTSFVMSITSFDSKFDQAMTDAASIQEPFASFSSEENLGKALFLAPPDVNQTGTRIGRGLGCAGCHRPPEFDIDPASLNNGVDHKAGRPDSLDITNTRAPSLRDVLGIDGQPNGPMMHTGDFVAFETVIEHYDLIQQTTQNTMLDQRLHRGPNNLYLNTTTEERLALEAFIKTLTGSNVYSDVRWSNPFK